MISIKRIVFWEPCASPHKADFFSALAKLAPSIEVICCASSDLSEERKAQGWAIKPTDAFYTIVAPSQDEIELLVTEQMGSSLHIFSGIRWVSSIVGGLKAVRKHGAKFAIMSEPRVAEGWKGKVRSLQSWITEGWLRNHVEFVLGQGRNGPPWFLSVGYSTDRVFPFAYFVDPPTLNLCEANMARSKKQIIQVGYVGRLVKMKGVFDLVEAVAQLGKSAKLSLVGAGPEEAALKESCTAHQLNINFFGVLPMSEIGTFMQKMDVLVLPSTEKDGWGVVVSEALMAGTAVVATTCVGASLVLDEPVFGRCVPAQSPNDIAQAIKQLQSEDAFTSAMRYRRAMMALQCLSAEGGARYFLEIIQWRFAKAARPQPFYLIKDYSMKILRVISSVNPQGGGPIEGVIQLSAAHRNMGVEVEICSLDAPTAEWVINSQTQVHALGSSSGYGYNKRLIPWLRANAHQYDAVIVEGLWQYIGFAVWRALAGTSTPYYVFSHGMLDPWFKHTYPLKHLKKWLYWPWAEYRVLRDARRVIFTCEEERLLARKSFWLYKAHEAVTAFGVANPPANRDELTAKFLAQFPQLQGKRIALYLSRIHVKKGCDLLIDAFAQVAKQDENLHLVMAGPDQIGWVPKLQAQAEKFGIAHRITWPGMLQGDMKWGAFYAAEVFVLPSHQENFGIVVAEALACGKPVLISNKVNIWREIEADGAGLVADDTQAGTDDLLNRWLGMGAADFAAMRAKTIPCFQNRFHVQKAAEQLLEIIRESK